jgi:hypothetical protein
MVSDCLPLYNVDNAQSMTEPLLDSSEAEA